MEHDHRDDFEPGGHGGHGPGHGRPPVYRGPRVAVYYALLVVVNVLLAVYLLYAVGTAVENNWAAIQSGSQTAMEKVLVILLMASPVLLTLVVNRLLLRAVRGRRRFPRGTAFVALLLIVLVQALTVYLVLRCGVVDGGAFSIETLQTAAAGLRI